MKHVMHIKLKKPIIIMILMLLAIMIQAPASSADSGLKLLVDGKDITESAAPQLLGGRTLVPVRFVAEELGADVTWNEAERTVVVTKGDRSVLLRIDSRLVTYDNQGRTYGLCDVAPTIINDRTYVPLRLVSNALGVGVGWQEASRTVTVDSAQSAVVTPFYDMKITTVKPGQRITGPIALQAAFPGTIPYGATEIKFLILDPDTAKGTVAIRGNTLSASYRWLPDLKISGERILVAAVYDAQGNFLAGDAVPITMAITPNVALAGIAEGQIIKETVSLSANPNFSANFVKYEITNLDTGKVFLTPEADPQGPYKWTPMMEDNGSLSIRVIAFDHSGLSYRGQPVLAQTALTQKLSLTGVTEGKSIEGPVTLAVARNFQVSQTDYVMLNPSTGAETLLARVGYVSYKWFPGPGLSGTRQLFVRVTDTKGVSHSSSPITVNLTGKARLLLEGVGPEQVISGTIKMKVSSNVALSSVQFTLTNANTGGRKVIAGGSDPLAEYSYTPEQGDAGSWRIQAEGTDESGRAITSESVSVTVYTGKLFTAKPIIEKSQFIGLASGLARNSFKTTGMSAALQTAQSILESGWGQSVPVDKYSGQLSYNLFGIKGTGTAGSVTSNTWEEYNGVAYRIDDEFRAYHNVAESWANHKSLLLTASRYGIFRDVMQSSTQGAWALRRAGYATDSKYPLKLIEIIRLYDLEKLDEIGI